VISDNKRGVFKKIGVTSRGTPVLINEIYLNASIRILLTDITMHYFAGFGGDRKSILPGVAAQESVNANHKMVTMQGAQTGKLKGNPIHEDMLEAARFAKPDFVVNVCVNDNDKIFSIKCGALNDAFLEAVSEYKKYFEAVISEQADLLIVSHGGYPHDINYYQSMKSLHQCISAVKKGGNILFLSQCPEGLGNAVFLEWIEKFSTADEVAIEIKRNFKQGANQAYFQYNFVNQYSLYIKTEMPEDLIVNTLKMIPLDNIQKVLDNLVMESKKIYIIAAGSKMMVSLEEV
jgi:nickel-dependent lactate racemase